MKKIAHRGYTTSFIKENTIEAFDNAINNDFSGIEFDIHATKDGKLVVIHDAWIDRTSDASGLVRHYTYEELSNFNFGSKEIPSKIPLAVDVLKRYKGTIKLVELKGHIDIASIVELIDDDTYIMSFDTNYIYKLKKKYPHIKFGSLSYVVNTEADYHLDMICLLDEVASDHLVEHFLSRGIRVFIYGIIGKIDYVTDKKDVYYIVDKKF